MYFAFHELGAKWFGKTSLTKNTIKKCDKLISTVKTKNPTNYEASHLSIRFARLSSEDKRAHSSQSKFDRLVRSPLPFYAVIYFYSLFLVFFFFFSHSSALDTNYNIKVAIKKLARPFQSAVHAKRTYRELRLLKHMNHENVIGLLDVFHPGSNTIDSFQQVYLCTHLMGADLNNIIRTQRLSDDHVQFLVYQILRGLKYIHSAGIIHRVCFRF